jgi:hypothetical protein
LRWKKHALLNDELVDTHRGAKIANYLIISMASPLTNFAFKIYGLGNDAFVRASRHSASACRHFPAVRTSLQISNQNPIETDEDEDDNDTMKKTTMP